MDPVAYWRRPRSNAALVRMLLRDSPRLPDGTLCQVCGKHRYATEQAAQRILRLRQFGHWRERTERRAYYEHGWWHLTSTDEREAA